MIWCVEDDASIRDIEVYALKSAGLDARGFEDGSSFLKALEAEAPTLVVLDVMLPGVDGMELLRRMRESVRLKAVPVIMATARDAEIDKDELPGCFPDFRPYLGDCRFNSCTHVADKGCAVCAAVERGEISESRHNSYVEFYNQVKDIKKWERK